MPQRLGLHAASRNILICAVAALASGCAHTPSQTLQTSAPETGAASNALDAAARAAVSQDAALLSASPADSANFCPAYANLDVAGREAFWSTLVEAVADKESHGNASRVTWRPYDPVVSRPTFRRGLLQVSSEAADSKAFHCNLPKGADLTDPATNVACGVQILEEEVAHDGVIAQAADGKPGGAARYWPSLRKDASRREIEAATKAVRACSAG